MNFDNNMVNIYQSNNNKNNNDKKENNEIKFENKPESESNSTKPEENETLSNQNKSSTEDEISNSLKNNSINNAQDLKNKEVEKIVPKSFIKLDKNGNPVNISGYYTFQLLGGFLIDCCVFIRIKLLSRNISPYLKDLLELCIDVIIYIANCVKLNLNKYKTLMSNRKLIIVSQIYAVLASFELVLTNFHEFCQYELSIFKEINEKFKKFKIFSNICYEILIESKKTNALPFKLLNNLVKFVADDNVNEKIDNYDKNEVYKVFLSHLENLSENELKNIKNNELMKKKCIYAINMIFGKSKAVYINACYNSYLINCLKCNNLEKKMNALNDINEIIDSISREEIDKNFYDFFIKKNKILDIFFEESIHEEILKKKNGKYK